MERFALQGLGSGVVESEVLVEPTENAVTNGATVSGAAERQDEILRHRPGGGSIEPASLSVTHECPQRPCLLVEGITEGPAQLDVAFDLLAEKGGEGHAAPPGNARGAPLTGHTSPVSAVRFSPDGEVLATAGSGGDERTVRLWNVGDRGVIGRLTGHLDSVTDVVFSPDGTMLATASADTTIRLWSLSSRMQIASLRGHGGPVRAVTFSPDGKLLASAGADGTVRLWDVERRAPIANLKARDEVNAVAFSPDGKLLASGGRENTVRLWDVGDRRAKGAIDIVSTTSGWVRSLAFSPDGRALAAGSVDNRIRIWSATGGDLLVELTGHGNSVNDIAFHQGPGPELSLASAGDRTVRLWNLTGRLP
jgi:WD40 repeat protein